MRRKKIFLGGMLAGSVLLVVSLVLGLPDGKLHLVFCDVGQGDAIYIRTPKGADILIDGGPDGRVINCLSKYMPFWNRKIELAFLTHPQADHLNGFLAVIERYNIEHFGMGPEGNETIGYKKLLEILKKNNVSVFNPYWGEQISFSDGVSIEVVWPQKEWAMARLGKAEIAKENGGVVLGVATSQELNDFSIVLALKYGNFDSLLMGDADSHVQDDILRLGGLTSVEVLKVPHHGSRNGLTNEFLERVRPVLAVISVGKNSYGHPAKEILEKLGIAGAKVLRTDEKGDIVVVSEGEEFRIVN